MANPMPDVPPVIMHVRPANRSKDFRAGPLPVCVVDHDHPLEGLDNEGAIVRRCGWSLVLHNVDHDVDAAAPRKRERRICVWYMAES